MPGAWDERDVQSSEGGAQDLAWQQVWGERWGAQGRCWERIAVGRWRWWCPNPEMVHTDHVIGTAGSLPSIWSWFEIRTVCRWSDISQISILWFVSQKGPGISIPQFQRPSTILYWHRRKSDIPLAGLIRTSGIKSRRLSSTIASHNIQQRTARTDTSFTINGARVLSEIPCHCRL